MPSWSNSGAQGRQGRRVKKLATSDDDVDLAANAAAILLWLLRPGRAVSDTQASAVSATGDDAISKSKPNL